MKITRIRAGDDGESHFKELELPEKETPRRSNTATVPATGFSFGLSEPLTPQGWHHAPARQLVAVLSGLLEIECGDGSKARFGPGDAFIADDLAGHGHITRDLEGPVRLLYVLLPPEADFDQWE